MKNFLICLTIVCLAALTSCSHSNKAEPQAADSNVVPSSQSKNEYPHLVLKLTDGQELATRQLTGKNIFVLFQPECDHCQEEAVLIEQRIEDFKGYTLYFISSAPIEQIAAFAETFELHHKPNVKFAWTSTEGVLNHYGAIQTPSVYIYSDGELKQSFNGQTDIETLIDAL